MLLLKQAVKDVKNNFMVESFVESKENIRIHFLKVQIYRKKTKLFGYQSRKAPRYLIAKRSTYLSEATHTEIEECDLGGTSG